MGDAGDGYNEMGEEKLRHMLRVRDRQIRFSEQSWVRAAKRALDGDTRELANRVALAEAPPVQVVLSEVTRP